MVVETALMLAEAVQVSSSVPWALIIEVLSALVTIGGAALWLLKQIREQRLRNERFDRDWYGEPERPGVPARPGVMEQLLSLRTDVNFIKTEVEYNHGSTIKDAVEVTRTTVAEMKDDIRILHERLDGKQPDVHA